MSEFTILSKKQVFGDDKLDILKKRGTKATVTDFAILLGARIPSLEDIKNGSKYAYVNDDNATLANRTGEYLTCSNTQEPTGLGDYYLTVVNKNGIEGKSFADIDFTSARPAIKLSSLNSKDYKVTRAEDGILEVEYGHYPQQAANKKTQKELELLFEAKTLPTTGNSFTVTEEKNVLLEYEYKRKKYTRVIADFSDNNVLNYLHYELSNRGKYQKKDAVWVEVQPVKWWLDEKTGIMLSENSLFSGVPLHQSSIYNGNFNDSDLNQYLGKYFARDLVQHLKKPVITNFTPESTPERLSHLYDFDDTQANEEDVIKKASLNSVLNDTKKLETLRSLIGEELTDEFVNFCQHQNIKMDDALSGSYNQTESISKKR